MQHTIKKLLMAFIMTMALSSLSFGTEKISYSGRLTAANGAPITGPVSLTLNIVTSAPTILCTVNDAAVPLSNGVFHFEVDYGSSCSGGKTLRQTLVDSIAASEEVFIQVVDQTNSKTYPSQAITSTPLATVALEATSVTTGSLVNTSLSGVAANCANNEVIAGDGSGNFKCIPASTGSVTSITAGTGLTGGAITSTGTIAVDVGTTSGKIPQLDGSGKLATSVETDPTVTAFAKTSLPTCGAGEVLKSDGTSFSCVTDDSGTDTDTTYTAGTGLDLTAGQFSVDASSCAAGERMIFGAPGFGCEDADAISIQGNDIDNAAPSDNDVLTWNNTTSKWEPRAAGVGGAESVDDLSDGKTAGNSIYLGTNTGSADSGTTNMNVGVGHEALQSNTTGWSNTAVGGWAMKNNTTGYSNTATGNFSLYNNSTGGQNTAYGYNSSRLNTTGGQNVSVGHNSLYSNTSGSKNTAIGESALRSNTTGEENTALGYYALYDSTGYYNVGIGAFALSNVSAYYNTALGRKAGDSITTGTRNILIGYDVDTPLATTSNHINIGDTIYGDIASGNVGIGVIEPTEKLDVNGNVKATAFYGDGSNLTGVSSSSSSSIANATINADSDTNGSGDILFQTRGTTRASISNLGDMTIGTTLHTGSGVTSFSVGSATEPSVISLGEDTNNKGAITWDDTDNYVSIGTRSASTNYTDTLVVKDGKVGILTDTPDALLTIAPGNQNVNSKAVGLEFIGSYYINGGGNNAAGISSILTSRSGNINVPYIAAIRGIQKCTPTTTSSCGDNYGGYFELSNDSTHATGTVSDGSAIYALAKHTSTSVPTTKISAAELKVSVAASGTVTEANGVLVRAPSNSGTITNFNGLSIDSLTSIGTVTTANAIIYNHSTTPFAVKTDGKVGIGTSSPSNRLSVSGPDDSSTGPIVNIHGSVNNQFEGGRVRFTESGANLQGAYIHYDASSANKLHIGVHETADSLIASDTNIITLLRSNGRVGIGTESPSEELEVNGNVKATAYLYTSDRRFKKNIETVNDPLEKVLALRGVFFDWRTDEFDQFNLPSGKEYGFIAQEVEEVAPELVSTGENGYKSVKYGNITSLLIEAFKTLEKKISSYFETNDEEIKVLNRKIASLEKENKELKGKSIHNEKKLEQMEKDIQLILKKIDK